MKNELEEILKRWEEENKKCFEQLIPRVREIRERIKRKISVKVWLAGPGRNHELYFLRELIAEFLKRENFEVFLSEDYPEEADLVSKELEEIEALDLAIILAITPGASAEAVEFAHYLHIRPKLYVCVPEEYKNGYIVRSLFGKHRIIGEDSFFSLEKIRQHDSELAIKIKNRAIHCRRNLYRKKEMKKCFDDSA